MTMLFAVVSFLIFGAFFRNPLPLYGRNIPATLETVLLPRRELEAAVVATGDGSAGARPSEPFAKFRIANKRGFGVKDAVITASIASFSVPPLVAGTVRCNPLAATLLVQQYAYLCDALLDGTATTDANGVAVFDATRFAPGTQPGKYNVTFVSGPFSTSVEVTVTSPVAYLDFTVPPLASLSDFTGVFIGDSASIPFYVTPYDAEGNPLAGRIVRLVSRSIDGSIVIPVDEYHPTRADKVVYLPLPQSDKVILLENNVATTNATGAAAFEALTVVAASHPVAYLTFICDGAALDLFADAFRPPIVFTDADAITIVEQPSATVVEGQPLAVQPRLRVTNAAGAGLAGRTAFALIARRDGVPEPEFLQYVNPLEDRKQLTNPISGKTDADGFVTFANLGFGIDGPAGVYTLVFVVDGLGSEVSQDITVTTTVATVSVSYFPVLPISVPYEEVNFPVVAISDANGRPVPGKTPKLIPNPRARGQSHAQPSLANGLAFFDLLTVTAVDFDSTYGVDPIPFPPTHLTFVVDVDGVRTSLNVSFVPASDQYVAPVATWIETVTPPPALILPTDVLNVSLTLLNAFMDPIPLTPSILFSNPLIPSGIFFQTAVRLVNSATFVSTYELIPATAQVDYYNTTLVDEPWRATAFPYLFGVNGYTGSFTYQISLAPGGSANAGRSSPVASNLFEAVLYNPISTYLSSVQADLSVIVRDDANALVPNSYVQLNVLPYTSVDVTFLSLLGEVPLTGVVSSAVAGFTNASGVCAFGAPTFLPNVVGPVDVFFYAGGKLLTGLVKVNVPRVVANITIVTPAVYFDATALDSANADVMPFFVPFTTQPQVRLLDAAGDPVVGARALIAVAQDPTTYSYFEQSDEAFVGRVTVASGEEAKVASMFSLPSDATGLATFEDIGVWYAVGADGSPLKTPATLRLRYFSDGGAGIDGGPIHDVGTPNTVRVLDTVTIAIVQQPSSVASLGVPFAKPITLSLTTASGVVPDVTYATVSVVSGPVVTNADGSNTSLAASARISQSLWPFQARSKFVVDTKFERGAAGRYELAVSFPGAPSVVLEPIELTSRVSSLRLVRQPPLVVPVGGLFRISVRASIKSGAVLGGVVVQARLIRGTTSVAKAIRLDQIGRNRLDASRVSNATDTNGIADLSLTVESAEPGLFTLVITTTDGLVASLPSRPFLVTNNVKKVTLLQQPTGLAKPLIPTRTLNGRSDTVLITSEGDQGVSTMQQPVVRVTGDLGDAKNVPLPGVAIEAVVVQSSTTDGSLSGTTITAQDVSRPELLWSRGTAVSDANGVARFSDLRFTSGATGAYRLIFRGRGIESVASAPFLVTNVLVPDAERLSSFRAFVFVVLILMLPMLYGNIMGNSRYAIVGADAFEVTLNVVTIVALLAVLVWFVVVLVGTFRGAATFVEKREVLAFETVKRLLSPTHANQYWEDKLREAAGSRIRRWRIALADKLPSVLADKIDPGPLDDGSGNPFEPFETKADFVYPQRLVIAAFVAGFFVAIMTLGAVVAVLWVRYYADLAFQQLLKVELLLERQQQALQATAAASGLDTSAGDLKVALSASSSLSHYLVGLVSSPVFTELRKALLDAGAVAVVGTLIFVGVMWYLLLVNYRKNVFRLRRGLVDKVLYKQSKYKALRAPAYIGMQTVHTLAGYATTFLILWILVQKFIIARYVVSSDHPFLLPNPRWWSLYELVYTFLNIVNGVSLTIVRFSGALGALVFTFLRMDYPVVNKTREHADPGFHAYVAMLLLDHVHNNPVVVVASQIFIQSLLYGRARDGADIVPYRLRIDDPDSGFPSPPKPRLSPTARRARLRWALAVTLINNPSLRAERWFALEAAAAARAVLRAPGLVVTSHTTLDDEMFVGAVAAGNTDGQRAAPIGASRVVSTAPALDGGSNSADGVELEMFPGVTAVSVAPAPSHHPAHALSENSSSEHSSTPE
ncbi:uncharacterized protein AMSG_07193 [Thecamonas trahens ATCC 50062]|uniref:Uncharacterized protein n=1 Tax=Thecamonas trahens ATCC 50062 TaxID=461836 RepID=A0A0L0DI19_THETB|nr:hypothetical protein AMSG_07193 [Thecamonas trahens ATCC 50062]KNC50943.1 hypothetical protein AMSG_07193 [Thecamonas trahens ATCC 50062]|eukprot:XP_013756640.1 hypothetical protein AMSG_07193 [Thecamonas trahens ATCC 50062]